MRVLSTVWNFPGCIHPHLAVARALRERGHEVAIYTGDDYRETALREGLRFFPFQPFLQQVVQDKVFSEDSVGANWSRPWRVPKLIREFFADTIPAQLEDLESALDGFRPDAVLCDPALFAPYVILHEKRGLPVAILSYVLGCTIPGPEIPPGGIGLPLPRNGAQRLRNTVLGGAVNHSFAPLRRAVNRQRVAHGLRPMKGSVVECSAGMPLHLVTSCRELDYPRTDLPDQVHYVGPCFWYPPRQASPQIDALPRDLRCVYINEGTIHVAEPYILRAAVAGLADLPIRVVLTTGKHRRLEDLGLHSIPDNFVVEAWVNHDHLMPKLDAMVCTGGPGTVLAALVRGVPMVVIPTEWDHPENAQRLVEAGVAIRLEPKLCNASRLRAAVREILDCPSYRENAQKIGKALVNRGGAASVATLLEQMVRRVAAAS